MGSGSSKPGQTSTQHVFASETPVRFSQDLVDALQASPETDSTRTKDLESHIQSRVHAELSRLEAETSQSLKELEDHISSMSDSRPTTLTTHQPGMLDKSPSEDKTKAEADRVRDLSRVSVQKEIDGLKRKLQERRMREDVVGDKEVEKAREQVVNCLRINDRRPLDCWKEVEGFKREVGRLEAAFLGRVLE